MSSTSDMVYETFLALAQGVGGSGFGVGSTLGAGDLSAATADLTRQMSDTADTMKAAMVQVSPMGLQAPVTSTPAASTTTTTTTGSESTVSSVLSSVFGGIPAVGAVTSAVSGGGGGGIGSTLESVGKTILESGFGLIPLLGGLFGGLFGGGDSSTTQQLVKYAMPAKIGFQEAESDGSVSNSDYGQDGMPRVMDYGSGGSTLAASSAPASGSSSAAGAAAPAPAAAATPQITVNVQAMDARSFMDRSSDIAAAVRDAMLSLNPINDVVNDL